MKKKITKADEYEKVQKGTEEIHLLDDEIVNRKVIAEKLEKDYRKAESDSLKKEKDFLKNRKEFEKIQVEVEKIASLRREKERELLLLKAETKWNEAEVSSTVADALSKEIQFLHEEAIRLVNDVDSKAELLKRQQIDLTKNLENQFATEKLRREKVTKKVLGDIKNRRTELEARKAAETSRYESLIKASKHRMEDLTKELNTSKVKDNKK